MRNSASGVVPALAVLLFVLLVAGPGTHSQSLDNHYGGSKPDRGTYTTSIIYPNYPKYADVEKLTRDSSSIAVGTVQSGSSKSLPTRKDFIFTDYQVSVKRILKGSLKRGDNISVIVPGGKIKVDEDQSRELTVPSYWKNPQIGRTYVFFLRDRDGSNQHFDLIGGPQGLFAINADKRIEPQVLRGDPLMRKHRNKESRIFLQEIMGEVQRRETKP